MHPSPSCPPYYIDALHTSLQVDNSSRPFYPKLLSKPNAIVPLEIRLEGTESQIVHSHEGVYMNPYAPEIDAFIPTEVCLWGAGKGGQA